MKHDKINSRFSLLGVHGWISRDQGESIYGNTERRFKMIFRLGVLFCSPGGLACVAKDLHLAFIGESEAHG